MNSITQKVLIVALICLSLVDAANAECYIYTPACPGNGESTAHWIQDWFPPANYDANTCLHRARYYHSQCLLSPSSAVYAQFNDGSGRPQFLVSVLPVIQSAVYSFDPAMNGWVFERYGNY